MKKIILPFLIVSVLLGSASIAAPPTISLRSNLSTYVREIPIFPRPLDVGFEVVFRQRGVDYRATRNQHSMYISVYDPRGGERWRQIVLNRRTPASYVFSPGLYLINFVPSLYLADPNFDRTYVTIQLMVTGAAGEMSRVSEIWECTLAVSRAYIDTRDREGVRYLIEPASGGYKIVIEYPEREPLPVSTLGLTRIS